MRNFKTRKCPYLAHFGLKWKNKTTLFCQTFKVEEKKVVSFFNFELNQARYGHFLVFDIFALMSPFVKFEPPCGTPKSVPIWLKIFLVYILMYWNGINNLLSTFETLFEIWSTLQSHRCKTILCCERRVWGSSEHKQMLTQPKICLCCWNLVYASIALRSAT